MRKVEKEGSRDMGAKLQITALADPRHLPTPPAAAMELLRLSRDPDAGVPDMAAVLSLDSGLAAKIIATANSVVYRRDREATTIDRAIGQIGVRGVVTMALAHSVAGQLPRDGQIAGIDLAYYWRHSLATAVACRELAPHSPDEAFLLGLLADVGKIGMARSLEVDYEVVADAAEGWPSFGEETAAFGVNSLQVSAEALVRWSMPEVFPAAATACADRTPSTVAGAQPLADALSVALEIASFSIGGGSPEALQLVHDAAGRIGVSVDTVEGLIAGMAENMTQAAETLAMNIDDADYETLLDDARMQLVDLSLQADLQHQRDQVRLDELERTNAELEARALTDSLTGLANRSAFDRALEQQIRLRMREPEMFTKPIGVVMIDIDHFKVVNDTHGHQIGDEVLQQLGLVMQMMSRSEETAARYGGEEFVIVAPVATPEDLWVVCERIRKAVELIEVVTPLGPIHITASLGGACISGVSAIPDGQRVLEAADRQLYEAKDGGRNQSRILQEPLRGL